jgi:arsenate reductase
MQETVHIYHQGEDSVPKIKALLKGNEYAYLSKNILEEPFTGTQIMQIARKMKVDLLSLVNKESELFTSTMANSSYDDGDLLNILNEHPELLKTPLAQYRDHYEHIENPRQILKIIDVDDQDVDGYDHQSEINS